jgi:hypothetical protein
MARKKKATPAAAGPRQYTTDARPWALQEWEQEASHRRFKAYLACGPMRSADACYDKLAEAIIKEEMERRKDEPDLNQVALDAAEKAKRPLGADRNLWRQDAVANRWEERAKLFDAEHLLEHTIDAFRKYGKSLSLITAKLLDAIAKLEPRDWSEVLATLREIHVLLPSETFQAVFTDARDTWARLVERQARPLLDGPGGLHQGRAEDHPDAGPAEDIQPGPDAAQPGPG